MVIALRHVKWVISALSRLSAGNVEFLEDKCKDRAHAIEYSMPWMMQIFNALRERIKSTEEQTPPHWNPAWKKPSPDDFARMENILKKCIGGYLERAAFGAMVYSMSVGAGRF